MSGIASFVVVLLVLVVVHELGHFTVAKLAGVRVLEFGVGFPPRVLSRQWGDTTYSLNLLPLGGFVRMIGEEDPTDPGSLARRSAPIRLAVLAAGSAMNALLPLVLFTLVFMLPQDTIVTDVAVLDVAAGSPAERAGVQPGDVITHADGRRLDNSFDLQAAVQRRLGADTTWTLQRQGRTLELHIAEARVDPPEGQGATGILLADGRVTVASVARGSAAAQAGLQSGDLFLRVGSSGVVGDGDAQAALDAWAEGSPGEPVPIVVLRDGTLTPLEAEPGAGGLDGLTVAVRPTERRSEPVWRAVPMSFRQTWDILVIFRNEISRIIAGASSVDLVGPVGIARITSEVAGAGLGSLLMWTALLSINLAIVNMLPIPALDGGRIMFVLIELARGGRRLSPERERIAHMVGFAILISGIVAVSIGDIRRIVSGESVFGG
ncbi:MAG: RIP metalloprotease RseP [Chloroflexi bacterium]|nr:RIP metalloprotease RseP [Chloroflexota bacterium]